MWKIPLIIQSAGPDSFDLGFPHTTIAYHRQYTQMAKLGEITGKTRVLPCGKIIHHNTKS